MYNSKSIDELEKSTASLHEEQNYTAYNLYQFTRHFNKYYIYLSNAVEDMRAEVQMMRDDNATIIQYLTKDIEEGEVCKKCGEPLI